MEFKASLDTLAKIITGFGIAIFAFYAARSIQVLVNPDSDMHTIAIRTGAFAFLTIVVLFAFLLAPQKYILTLDELIIKRPFKSVHIKFTDIAEVQALPDNEFVMSLRTFGVGGLFGYFGKFYHPVTGNYTAYATRRTNRILLRTKGGEKLIITPDDINMVSHIEERMPV